MFKINIHKLCHLIPIICLINAVIISCIPYTHCVYQNSKKFITNPYYNHKIHMFGTPHVHGRIEYVNIHGHVTLSLGKNAKLYLNNKYYKKRHKHYKLDISKYNYRHRYYDITHRFILILPNGKKKNLDIRLIPKGFVITYNRYKMLYSNKAFNKEYKYLSKHYGHSVLYKEVNPRSFLLCRYSRQRMNTMANYNTYSLNESNAQLEYAHLYKESKNVHKLINYKSKRSTKLNVTE